MSRLVYVDIVIEKKITDGTMKTKRLTDDDIIKELIDAMFLIAGHDVTFEDVKGRKDKWYEQWTMTAEQEQKWMEHMIKYFRKHRGLTARYAQTAASMFNLMWGLKVERPEVPDIDNIN
jgi:hypothetical protein